jgi:hypothetical protein
MARRALMVRPPSSKRRQMFSTSRQGSSAAWRRRRSTYWYGRLVRYKPNPIRTANAIGTPITATSDLALHIAGAYHRPDVQPEVAVRRSSRRHQRHHVSTSVQAAEPGGAGARVASSMSPRPVADLRQRPCGCAHPSSSTKRDAGSRRGLVGVLTLTSLALARRHGIGARATGQQMTGDHRAVRTPGHP